MFGGGRQFGRPPQDPFQDMMDHVFGGSFFGPPSFRTSGDLFFGDPFFPGVDPFGGRGGHPFFGDPFFGMPRTQSQMRHAAPDVSSTRIDRLLQCSIIKATATPWYEATAEPRLSRIRLERSANSVC